MGVVWKAIDTTLDRPVAIKFLPDEFAADSQRLARLAREAKTIAALNHPNIVTVHSVHNEAGRRFMIMELVPGKTLAETIPPDGLDLERFFGIAIPIARAVEAAHQRGITHRDLKPSNVMVAEGGVVKVLDFGLARSVQRKDRRSEDDSTASFDGELGLSGTLHYMSPEQVQGETVEERSDIFTLGVMLYEMATGRHPFKANTTVGLIASILKDRPQPLTELAPTVPPRLARLVEHCLEKESAWRLKSAAELRRQLEGLQSVDDETGEQARSIAVLPFADMSAERDQDYFCEGLAEEIINALTRLESLKVASRTSSFQFKTTELDSRRIGDRLGVQSLLEGSVRKADTRLRITVELTDVVNGYQLWSARYDRELKDVFAIQDEIAQSIVEALRVELSPRERRAIKQVATADAEAFDYYLRGRKYFYQYCKQGVESAIQMFERAIELDPTYALAHAGIADCCAFVYMNAGCSEEIRRRAVRASNRALELDPDLPEAHTSRAVALSLSQQYEEAERAFEAAIELNPKLFEAYYFYARETFTRGDCERAIELYERASELRPDDYQSPLLSAQIYDDLGRKEEGEAARRRGLRRVDERLDLTPDDARALYMAANAHIVLGNRDRGLAAAARARELAPSDPMTLYNLGCIYAMAGEAELALDCLERALETGFSHRPWLRQDSNLDPVRKHPRFVRLVESLDTRIDESVAEAP